MPLVTLIVRSFSLLVLLVDLSKSGSLHILLIRIVNGRLIRSVTDVSYVGSR